MDRLDAMEAAYVLGISDDVATESFLKKMKEKHQRRKADKAMAKQVKEIYKTEKAIIMKDAKILAESLSKKLNIEINVMESSKDSINIEFSSNRRSVTVQIYDALEAAFYMNTKYKLSYDIRNYDNGYYLTPVDIISENSLKSKATKADLVKVWKVEHDKIISYCKSLYKKMKAKYTDLYFEPEIDAIIGDGNEIEFWPQGEFGVNDSSRDDYDWDRIYKCHQEIESSLITFTKPLAEAMYKKTGNGIYLRMNNDHIGFTFYFVDGSKEHEKDVVEMKRNGGFITHRY